MPNSPLGAGISPAPMVPPSPVRRRFGIAGFAALSIVLCSGAASPATPASDRIAGPSGGQVAGAAIGAGAVIALVVVVVVNGGHHTLTGCVLSGTNGLELQTSDSKRYALEGESAGIKVGGRVKIKGSRVKKNTGTTGEQVFRVEKLKKDYGPCPVSSSTPTQPAP